MTTALLRQIQAQDQKELADRHNGERKRRRSEWVIDQMLRALPPEHIGLANRIIDLQATAEGVVLPGYERVDGCGNSREGAMVARLHAQTQLTGYEAAVRTRLGRAGSRCFWAIAWGHSLAETVRACDYKQGSHATVKRLVQLTMLAAQDYDDAIRASARGAEGEAESKARRQHKA